MLSKKEIKHRLQAYQYCTSKLDKLYDKYQELKARAEKMTPAYSLAPGGGGSQDTMADTTALLADVEREYQAERHDLISTMHEVEAIISAVSDYRMRSVLEYHYINFYDLHQVAEEMHFTYDYVRRLHGWALLELRKKLCTK
jgi:hypothetical protein